MPVEDRLDAAQVAERPVVAESDFRRLIRSAFTLPFGSSTRASWTFSTEQNPAGGGFHVQPPVCGEVHFLLPKLQDGASYVIKDFSNTTAWKAAVPARASCGALTGGGGWEAIRFRRLKGHESNHQAITRLKGRRPI